MILNFSPVAPMIAALLIPIIYSIKYQQKNLKQIILLTVLTLTIIILYPLTTFLQTNLHQAIGYFLGKLIIFTLLPLTTVLYLEKQTLKKTVTELGITQKNLYISILLSLLVVGITLVVILVFLINNIPKTNSLWNFVMFLDAFNEEFFFRSIIFLYLWKLTNVQVAATTAILAFILAHPQYYYPTLIVGGFLQTVFQGVLLTLVTYKTKNIIGPWISHGLNRVLPQLLRVFII